MSSSNPIQCSGCGRPASLQRTTCMYCGKPIEQATSKQAVSVTELIPTDTSYVQYIPSQESDLSIVTGPFPASSKDRRQMPVWDRRLVSDLTHMSGDIEYSIEQKLKGERPFVLRGGLTPVQAEVTLLKLHKAGYPAAAISQKEIRSSKPATICQRLTRSGEHWQMWLEGGDLQRLDWSDVFFVVLGKLEWEQKSDIERQIVVGHGRNKRVVTDRSVLKNHKHETVFQLYLWSSMQPIRISLQKTEMSDFWDPLRESHSTASNKLVQEIQSHSPCCFWDRRFQGALTNVEEVTLGQRLQHLSSEGSPNMVSKETRGNEDAFRQYAAMLHLYYRRLWHTSGHSQWPPEQKQVEESKKEPEKKDIFSGPSFTIS